MLCKGELVRVFHILLGQTWLYTPSLFHLVIDGLIRRPWEEIINQTSVLINPFSEVNIVITSVHNNQLLLLLTEVISFIDSSICFISSISNHANSSLIPSSFPLHIHSDLKSHQLYL
jgi:hypothetical protein